MTLQERILAAADRLESDFMQPAELDELPAELRTIAASVEELKERNNELEAGLRLCLQMLDGNQDMRADEYLQEHRRLRKLVEDSNNEFE